MSNNRKVFRVTISSDDVAAFLEECGASEWYAYDTGERIMTDDGPDAEAVLLVDPSARVTPRAEAALMH